MKVFQVHAVWDDLYEPIHIELTQNFFHPRRRRNDKIYSLTERGHVGLQKSLTHLFGHDGQISLRIQVVTSVIGVHDGNIAAIS